MADQLLMYSSNYTYMVGKNGDDSGYTRLDERTWHIGKKRHFLVELSRKIELEVIYLKFHLLS